MAIRKSLSVGEVPKSTLSTSVSGENTSTMPDHDQHELGHEVGQRQEDVQARRLLDPDHVQRRRAAPITSDASDDVGGRLAERLPEHPQVVRHEERRDGDRDDVVEHLAPCREEGPELVEGAPRERRRATRLREHRRRLGVGGRGAGEDEPGDQEHHRRHPEREDRDQPERVVDRRADVAVGGREQGARAEHALETPVAVGDTRPSSRSVCGRASRRA